MDFHNKVQRRLKRKFDTAAIITPIIIYTFRAQNQHRETGVERSDIYIIIYISAAALVAGDNLKQLAALSRIF